MQNRYTNLKIIGSYAFKHNKLKINDINQEPIKIPILSKNYYVKFIL